ncbi:MAG TPA: hypothetical protein VGY31_13825 [Terriglobia bacterium]|nr:hypothetical protein [Terriglobia bacterium]
MIRRALLAGGLIAMFTVVSLAADLSGSWVGTFSTPNGDIQLRFNFKADGAKLTGTVETPNGDTPISDGKINGDNFSFKVQVGDNEITHEGTISGDTIQMKVEGPWGSSQVTLKRAAEKKSSALRALTAARSRAA